MFLGTGNDLKLNIGPIGKSSFNPLAGNPALWLDFSDVSTLYQTSGTGSPVTADGQTIGYAKDKSGNNYHFIQSAATQRPLYKAAIQNGLSVARFDGTNDSLIGPLSTSGAQACMIVVVNDDGTIGTLLFTNVVDTIAFLTNSDYQFVEVPNKLTSFVRQNKNAGTEYRVDRADTARNGIYEYVNPATVAGSIRRNGVLGTNVVQTNTANGIGTNNSWELGAQTSTTRPYGGDVGEVLAWDSIPSDSLLASYRTYLINKWGF